ncbi:hypothetical protein J2I03_004516 [Escherichia coli]|nr:hypothetical protein [Escherichia coli]
MLQVSLFKKQAYRTIILYIQTDPQKAAREAERGREAWTLGQGMKKPVAGCYGRLTRWKGGGDVVYMALL